MVICSAAKSTHKHDYHRYIVKDGETVLGTRYDVVNVCSICRKVKALPLRERLIKADRGYLWPTTLEQIYDAFGKLPLLTENK